MKPIEAGSKYYVTEDGQVYSNHTGKFLKPSLSKGTGYYVVNVILNGKRKPEYIHRLVAKAYVINPLNKPEVNHKDGNKLNNHKDNLEWVTNAENIEHSVKNELVVKGQDHYSTDLTQEDVHCICEYLSAGWSARQISECSGINVSRAVVLNIRSRRDWVEIGCQYKWVEYPERAKRSTTS